MNASRLLLFSIIVSPAMLLGQKKEDILSIQRDVANLDDHVNQLKKSFEDKMTALTTLMQQYSDAQAKNAAALAALQRNIDEKLVDQQTKLVMPVATLGTKVDEMSTDFSSVRENVKELIRRMNDLDGKVSDISNAVRTLSAATTTLPPPPPADGSATAPAAGGTSPVTTAQQSPDAPPPGMSAELSYNSAFTDYQGKKDDLALDEFAKYLRYYHDSANAPNAQYFIGQIYYRGADYEDAAKAFDAVLEQFPKNSKTQESQYMKAVSLMKANHRNAAGEEFTSFIKNYPNTPRAKDARAHLIELGLEPASKRRSK